jgi:hypothetical protein
MDDDTQDACEAQAQNEERRRREDEAVRHGTDLLKQFRAEQIAYNDEWAAGMHRIRWGR